MSRTRSRKPVLVQAVDLLARQEHSSQRLGDKLRQRGYEEEEVSAAIRALEERGYLNDANACARQFQMLYEESRSSVRQICMKLMQRGFRRELVQGCVPKDIDERERRAARRCLELKYKPSADRKKMMQNLYAKGFGSSTIQAVVEEFAE